MKSNISILKAGFLAGLLTSVASSGDSKSINFDDFFRTRPDREMPICSATTYYRTGSLEACRETFFKLYFTFFTRHFFRFLFSSRRSIVYGVIGRQHQVSLFAVRWRLSKENPFNLKKNYFIWVFIAICAHQVAYWFGSCRILIWFMKRYSIKAID